MRDNLMRLVKKNGKYSRQVTDPAKIRVAENTISKYLWVLTKHNEYCQRIGEEKLCVKYSLELYPRLMKTEIVNR